MSNVFDEIQSNTKVLGLFMLLSIWNVISTSILVAMLIRVNIEHPKNFKHSCIEQVADQCAGYLEREYQSCIYVASQLCLESQKQEK